jgi:hypothetical protein
MKNTDCRLNSINDFNELGETILHFVRQDGTQVVVTMDLADAKLWRARMKHMIAKFEEPHAKKDVPSRN